jgi:hypothetical protein
MKKIKLILKIHYVKNHIIVKIEIILNFFNKTSSYWCRKSQISNIWVQRQNALARTLMVFMTQLVTVASYNTACVCRASLPFMSF